MKFLSRLAIFSKKPTSRHANPDDSTCCLCNTALSGTIAQDAWGNAAHRTHTIYFCSSCERILSPRASGGAFQYSDGRKICGLCKKIAISDNIRANRSRRKVLTLLESVRFDNIPKNIEIVLAHPQTLATHSGHQNTSGLTLSHFHFNDYKRVGISHKIGILFGLPKIEFEAVIAHELLHVWQHENGIKFSPLYAEGLCELGAYLIYTNDNSELANHFVQKMMKSKDAVYGNGFRLMLKKLENLSWPGLIQEILKNKQGFETSILNKIFGSKP